MFKDVVFDTRYLEISIRRLDLINAETTRLRRVLKIDISAPR